MLAYLKKNTGLVKSLLFARQSGNERGKDAEKSSQKGWQPPCSCRRDAWAACCFDQSQHARWRPKEPGLLWVADGGDQHHFEMPEVLRHPGCRTACHHWWSWRFVGRAGHHSTQSVKHAMYVRVYLYCWWVRWLTNKFHFQTCHLNIIPLLG